MSVKASVVMAVYNASRHIREALDSILSQSFEDFELIIVNDCSSDNSIDLINTYQDRRIKLIHNESNIGLAASLNKGIEISEGKYIIRMDDDDICKDYRFERLIDYMDANPDVGICGSWVQFFGDENYIWKTAEYHDQIRAKLFFNTALAHPSVIMRKTIIDQFHLQYDVNFRRAQDYDLFNRAAMVTQLHNIPEVLLDYRIAYKHKKATNHDMALSTLSEVRKRIYNQLEMEYTEETLIMHQKIGEGNFKKVNLQNLKIWISELRKKNDLLKVLPPNEFKMELADKWFKSIIYNLPQSLVFLPPYPSIFLDLAKKIFVRK